MNVCMYVCMYMNVVSSTQHHRTRQRLKTREKGPTIESEHFEVIFIILIFESKNYTLQTP